MQKIIQINSFKTDFGEIGHGDCLGYRDYVVSLDPDYEEWRTLGIHADSEISIRCFRPIVLCGGLNGTAMFYDRSPRVRFFVDGVPFGEAERPQQMIDRIVLSEGDHVLCTKIIDPARDIALYFWIEHVRETLAHTVWAFKPHESARVLATCQNTLFVSAAAFGNDVEEKTKMFRESAGEYGIPIELYDRDRKFSTFFEHKIKNFLANLTLWKNRGIEYVFSLDSRDIVFRHPADIILGKFNAIYDGRVLISKDIGGITHPLFAHWLPGHVQKIVGKDYEINTGVIAGHIDDLIKVYSNILTLREEFLGGGARSDLLAKLFLWQKKYPPHHQKFNIENDDQALHFLNIITRPEWYQIDANKTLSAFISDFPSYPRLCDPPHKLDSICAASILHGSRPASRGLWEKMYKKRWWEEDETKRENIPVQIPALELNVVYTCNLKCEYCAHLGRYVKGQVPLEAVQTWIDSWKNKVLPCMIRILGGEPLLHNNIDQIVRSVHEAWAEHHRVIVTNGLIERSDDSFIRAVRETETHLWVSVHHDSVKMHKVIDENIAKWQRAGLIVVKNLFTYEWRKCYRLEDGIPVPFDTDPKVAWDRCCTQRNCITLLDNHLYMCPQAALFQYAYNNKNVGEEWKLAADYKPLPPTCTWRELVHFVDCKHEQSICRMCPEQWHNATSEEKANLQGLENKDYLANLLQ
jgi:hypothetical protein